MKFFTNAISPTSTDIAVDLTMKDMESDPSVSVPCDESKTSNGSETNVDTNNNNINMDLKAVCRWKKIGLIVVVSTIVTLLALSYTFKRNREALLWLTMSQLAK